MRRKRLIELLGAEHCELADELMRHARWAASAVANEIDWRRPEIKRVRSLAQQLHTAISDLPGITDGMLEHIFHNESQRIFQDFELTEQGVIFYFALFQEQLRFLASEALTLPKVKGRPREQDRARLAQAAATEFLSSGLKPTKYRNGVFASVLKMLLREAGFPVPDDMYRIIVDGVTAAERNRRRQSAPAVAAKPPRGSNDESDPARSNRRRKKDAPT